MKENKNNDTCESCQTCEEAFEQNIERMVDEGTKPTYRRHHRMKEEVEQAFGDASKK